MNCWNCNTELKWGSDFDIDHENEYYSMMTALHCPNCKCDVEVYYPKENEMNKNLATADHVSALFDEIEYLRTLIKPQDTGHIYTAISVLNDHISQLLKEMERG